MTKNGYIKEPLWCPNEEAITFRSTSSSSGLYRINIQTGNINKFKTDPEQGVQLHPDAWSPNNDQLLVTTYELGRQLVNTLYIYSGGNKKMEKIYSKSAVNSNPAIYGADWFIKQKNKSMHYVTYN